MRSRAHFKAHPLHPALIPFPFAFLTGALLFDTIGLIRESRALWTTGAHLTIAGIAAGVLAAIPGIIDYLYTVPPGSSGKKRATRHGALNIIALALFGGAWALRGPDWSPSLASTALELVGASTLAYAGWLGGTLITRNLISVDHRYARAGKWKEEWFAGKAGEPLVVAHTDDLAADQMKLLHVNGHRIVLARKADHFIAFDDSCTHRGGSLAGGVMIDGTVQCLWHGSQFDGSTGGVRCGPARQPIGAYEVRQAQNGDVLLVSPPG
ncbi:MAG: Rieske 2Fe-2S domain-containing protein [Acidobacteria bacterium]|nr:Rieske 2Fe-2S domain-containing protein [Acidobacteriota bacterium]MCA1651023.1 Rieske 2Fe-2S domain-containing protein [Acidobacteriota bacterium]